VFIAASRSRFHSILFLSLQKKKKKKKEKEWYTHCDANRALRLYRHSPPPPPKKPACHTIRPRERSVRPPLRKGKKRKGGREKGEENRREHASIRARIQSRKKKKEREKRKRRRGEGRLLDGLRRGLGQHLRPRRHLLRARKGVYVKGERKRSKVADRRDTQATLSLLIKKNGKRERRRGEASAPSPRRPAFSNFYFLPHRKKKKKEEEGRGREQKKDPAARLAYIARVVSPSEFRSPLTGKKKKRKEKKGRGRGVDRVRASHSTARLTRRKKKKEGDREEFSGPTQRAADPYSLPHRRERGREGREKRRKGRRS